MRVHRIVEKTYAEGPGCRFCIWVQGCRHKCAGCFAVDLWDFNGGFYISAADVILKINSVANELSGVTFLGGEPFEYSAELAEIADYAHSININVITFTGYTLEELQACSDKKILLSKTDLLIDGRFVQSETDYSRPLVGSANQRFIFLTDRITENEINNYKNRFELRISKKGTLELNGMGNIEKLKNQLNKKENKI